MLVLLLPALTLMPSLALPIAAPPALPALRIDPARISVSGISSGADLAAHLAVAYADLFAGAAIFAGEPWLCAVTRFPAEPLYNCTTSPTGPGCTGFPGAAPCRGCPPGATLFYDHCKVPAEPEGPGWVKVPMLTSAARAAAAQGLISPTSLLSRTRVLAYRGSLDTVYLPGSVNRTAEFFAAFAASQGQQLLVLDVPSAHALPTIDPAVPKSSCGNSKAVPPAIENCGFDGAGESYKFFYGAASLRPPASPACDAACASRVTAFDQTRYFAVDWAGGELSSYGYVHVPAACAAGAVACGIHVSLHGCGMSIHSSSMGRNYTLYSGYNVWGEANNIVTLYPQSGGFLERGDKGPSPQIQAGCFDGYGQTREDFAYRSGPQLAAIANMVRALMGAA